MGLQFEIKELQDEAHAFRGLARDFLDSNSERVLRQVADDLIGVSKRADGTGPTRWEIRQRDPVRTVVSEGDYMPGGEGGLQVYAIINFKWELEPVRPRGTNRPAKIARLTGLASTEVRLMKAGIDGEGEIEIAVWRMEVGDDASPGCHFHVQVLGRDEDEIFPKALDVPRLPGSLVSPFACMEFVLSELFQAGWAKHVSKDSSFGNRWRKIQEHRLQKQLRWHLDTIAKASGSPWVSWKKAKPPEDLFLQ